MSTYVHIRIERTTKVEMPHLLWHTPDVTGAPMAVHQLMMMKRSRQPAHHHIDAITSMKLPFKVEQTCNCPIGGSYRRETEDSSLQPLL